MTFEAAYGVSQALFLLYLISLTGGYLLLNAISILSLPQYLEGWMGEYSPEAFMGEELKISIIVPAYNEAVTIASSIQCLLRLRYPEYEIIEVNDGSTGDTIDVLRQSFWVKPFPEAYGRDLPTQSIRATCHSSLYANICVIAKENGRKVDSLNGGINLSVSFSEACLPLSPHSV